MVKAVVFDMGGVLLRLDINKCIRALKEKAGFEDIEDYLNVYHQKGFVGELEAGNITADELYGWSGVSIAEEYTGVTLTVHRELQEGGESGEDPTEEYHAGIADDSGSAVASYDNPCVAAVNGQAVADWLLVMANRRKKYAVKNRCDPAVEIGDTLVIADAFRNDDRAVVTGLEIVYDGGLYATTEADREF
jgi:hypothetical protein